MEKSNSNFLSQRWVHLICKCFKVKFYFLDKSMTRDNINNAKFKTGLCTGRYSTSYPYQISVLIRRTFLIIMRDKTLTLNRLLTHFCIALFIGKWLQLELKLIFIYSTTANKQNYTSIQLQVKYYWILS